MEIQYYLTRNRIYIITNCAPHFIPYELQARVENKRTDSSISITRPQYFLAIFFNMEFLNPSYFTIINILVITNHNIDVSIINNTYYESRKNKNHKMYDVIQR